MNDVTLILRQIENGEASTDQLLPLVYDELRQLAKRKIRHEHSPASLEATALVHEAYIKLVGSETQHWENRGHFFAAAAESMRRILVDQARARLSQKRGGIDITLSLDTVGPITDAKASELVELNEALSDFESIDPSKAKLVKLKFFVGLTTQQTADLLGVPLRTAERNWAYARAWIYRQMSNK